MVVALSNSSINSFYIVGTVLCTGQLIVKCSTEIVLQKFSEAVRLQVAQLLHRKCSSICLLSTFRMLPLHQSRFGEAALKVLILLLIGSRQVSYY